MAYRRLTFALAGLIVAVTAACGGSNSYGSNSGNPTAVPTSPAAAPASSSVSPGQSSGQPVKVQLSSSAALGSIITDQDGRTLYIRTNDPAGKSTCDGSCAQNWPPLLTTADITAGSGLDAKELSTLKRDDGTTQVALNNQPLYYFVADKKAGDVAGQGVNAFGGIWYVLGADGSAIKGSAASAPAPAATQPATNYDYSGY
jgi:predicted lipoprotein with Yx(FWY)xxD motif